MVNGKRIATANQAIFDTGTSALCPCMAADTDRNDVDPSTDRRVSIIRRRLDEDADVQRRRCPCTNSWGKDVRHLLDTMILRLTSSQQRPRLLHRPVHHKRHRLFAIRQRGFPVSLVCLPRMRRMLTARINPPDLLYHPVDSDDLKGDCLSSIVATDQIENGSAWLLGDAFLRNVYFATNVHQTRAAISKRT